MHAGRDIHFVVGEKAPDQSERLSPNGGGCPMARAEAPGAAAPAAETMCAPIRFGRMFPPRWGDDKSEAELESVRQCLIALGRCMNSPTACHEGEARVQEESELPAGYTYLGQFITHEITFDKTEGLPLSKLTPENARSPSLDLDSLYGARPGDERRRRAGNPGDEKWKELYEEEGKSARLRIGTTEAPGSFGTTFENDLPRVRDGRRKSVAIIGDERNDENLPLAQTHVAFIKFHNRIVEDLAQGRYKDLPRQSAEQLFDKARAEVVRHFQWIILKDYLPRLVDEELVESLIRKPDKFNPGRRADLFIPVEFSAAAFRIGHSMVRQQYGWNRSHKTVALSQLFTHTKRSGNLNGLERLDSTWVIDWKRFYDFTPFAADYPLPYDPFPYHRFPNDPQQSYNKAGRIDTVFDLHLDQIEGFNHAGLPVEQQALTIRNLLRGLSLGLAWGEDVADALGERKLERWVVRAESHAELLGAEPFEGKTPLWFYILRESKVQENGGKLGRVGGRIVAETLIGLIRHSRYSILRKRRAGDSEWELTNWRPAYGRPSARPERVKFEMTDLLRAADVVDPLGKKVYQAELVQP